MLYPVRVRANWTATAGLLWAIALVIAGALAWWDYSDEPSADRAEAKGDAAVPSQTPQPQDNWAEFEVVYDEDPDN